MSNGASGPLWWDGELTDDPRPALAPDETVDVCIVGAGYTGLWTAYYLLKADPSLSVLVLEAEHVGFGASGRNGGWVSALYPVGHRTLARDHGRSAARDQYAALRDSVDEVGRVAEAEGIECGFHKGGTLVVARGPAQAARGRAEVRDSDYWGTGTTWLEASTAADRLAVQGLSGATFNPHCARIHPFRLVVARLLVDRGHRAAAAVGLGPDRSGRRRDVQRASARDRVRPALGGRRARLLAVAVRRITSAPASNPSSTQTQGFSRPCAGL